MSVFVHDSSVVGPDAKIGDGTKIWQNVIIQDGAEIGCNCNIGSNVYIEGGVKLGNGVKLKNGQSIICTGVEIEDDVFVGPNCTYTNVINPRAFISRKHEFKNTYIRKGATLGGNVTVVCGNTIGRYAMVGAGAVVTHDVDDYALVVGNPAKKIGYVCECGCKLNEELVCSECGKSYEKNDDQIKMRGEK